MVTTREITIPAPEEGRCAGHLALPDAGSGPGVLLLQEIFGVNDYIRAVAERIAGLGYVVLAPDVFWRVEPGAQLPHDEAGMARAFELLQGYLALGDDTMRADLAAALAALRARPEVTGRAGVVGFCLGGRLGYELAVHGDPDAVVAYYGSGIAAALDRAASISCPILLHFGTTDPFISVEEVDRIRDSIGARDTVDVRVYEGAGHAFDNPDGPGRDPAAAAAAWDATTDFLARTLRR